MHRLPLATLFFPLLAAAAPGPSPAPGFTPVREAGGIAEYRLDANGLRVLLRPQKLAPVATLMVTYHVGSRNEVTGVTGATHLLEHLMFKGTKRFDRSLGTGYDQILERLGAESNATTWLDRTNYFATVPAHALPLLVEVEADRMRNLAIREEDRRPEMTVVRNEFERGENLPYEALQKEIWAAAFIAHPYHHPTIGWRSDIETVPIARLREFYDTFYWPDNATVTVIGDFDPAATLAALRRHYGAIPRAPGPIPQVRTTEPEQTGQRRVLIRRAGELGIVALAHKIPQATHPDWPAIEVLSAILTRGKMSRCYRALTDRNLTVEVFGSAGFHHDPSLHVTTAFLNTGVKHADVEAGLVAEMEKIKRDGVTGEEVETAVAGLLAERAFRRDGSYAQAGEINECIAVGDWTLFVTLEEKIRSVRPDDVRRAARDYLAEPRSVAAWFVPVEPDPGQSPTAGTTGPADERFQPAKVLPPRPPAREPPAVSPGLARRVTRETSAGLDILACPTPAKGLVHLRLSLPAGEGVAPNRALAHLAAGMLERGTVKRDQFALATLLEKAGATIEHEVGTDRVEFSARFLTPDLPLVVSLLAEELRLPAFAAAEFAKLKKEFADEARLLREDTGKQAEIAFSRLVFPETHPARKNTIEELLAAVEKTRVDDVRAFHAAHYGPRSARLVAVGDFDVAAFNAAVRSAFAGWKTQPATPPTPPTPGPVAGTETAVEMPDKASVSVVIGQAMAVRASDPDWLALQTATHVLGSGFTSRLTGTVRDREGLTYGIHSWIDEDTSRPGRWQVAATFAPALLDRGLASTRREIEAWWRDGLTPEELAYRQSAIAGQFLVGLETTEGLARQLLRCAERGFDVSWLDEYPAKLKALTVPEINAAVRRHLDPRGMVTVKAGTLR